MTNATHIHAGTGKRALVLVFLAAIIEGFDLQAAGVAVPKLVSAFGLSPSQLGVFLSSATFGLVVGALCGGVIADRFDDATALPYRWSSLACFQSALHFPIRSNISL